MVVRGTESKLLFDADLQPILERAEDRLANLESLQKRAQHANMNAPGGVIGPDGRVIYAVNYYEGNAEHMKVEPYDFTSIIESKLSDIKLESFGREWLYDRMYEWLMTPQSSSQQKSKAVKSKILLVTGEPVRSIAL